MSLTIVSPTSELAVALEEAKLFCRVDGNDEDAILGLLISTAMERYQNRTGKQLLNVTMRGTFSSFSRIRLSRGPWQSLVSIEYMDTDGDWNVFASSNYKANLDNGLINVFGTLPSDVNVYESRPVRATWVCGYGYTNDSIPADIKHLILVMIATAYMQRESLSLTSVQEISAFFDGYMNSHRTIRF